MKFPIGSMTVGDILDRGLKILLARLPTFYLIDLIVLSPMIVLQLAAPLVGEALAAGSDPTIAQGLALIAGTFLGLVLLIILQPIGTAASLHIISQEFVGRHVGMGEAFGFALPCFLNLLGASILAGLAIVFGALACFVPGILFAVWFVFAPQVVVVENKSPTDALTRSKDLSEGFRWRIFALIILFIVIGFIVQGLVSILGLVLPPTENVPVDRSVGGLLPYRTVFHYTNYVVNTVVGFLLSILVQVYQAVCMTLLYFDLRIRKEGYDLELAAKQEGPPVS